MHNDAYDLVNLIDSSKLIESIEAYSKQQCLTWSLADTITIEQLTVHLSFHYDLGDCSVPEDRAFLGKNIIGVADGVSPPYLPGQTPRSTNGMSYGRYAAEVLARNAITSRSEEPLEEILLKTHNALRAHFIAQGSSDDHPSSFGATTGALCKFINRNRIDLISWGDAYYIALLKDGSTVGSRNWVYLHDEDQYRLRTELTHQHPNRDALGIWQLFIPTLTKLRDERINNPHSERGYGVLNGYNAEGFFALTSRTSLDLSICEAVYLVTDGMVDITQTYPEEKMQQYIKSWALKENLEQLKQDSFRHYCSRQDKTVPARPEATGVYLRLPFE